MVLTDLVMHLGRTAANIALDICRPEMLIGREAQFLTGTMSGWSDEAWEVSDDSNVKTVSKKNEKPICCLKSIYGKLDEKSMIALVLPLPTEHPTDNARNHLNDLALVNPFRRKAKGLLNASKATVPLPRAICTIACPMKPSLVRVLPKMHSLRNQQRQNSGRNDCAEWCGMDPCKLMRKDTVKKPSMWMDPNCFNKLVCEKPLRHDIVYMPGSNKATREYQQTWIECPPIRVVPKAVCCKEPLEMPPICRRPRKKRPATASYCQTTNICKQKNAACPKAAQSPCCDVGRENPSCKIYPTITCCHKRCTPFPAFSECCKPPFNKKAPVECLCLSRPTLCEIYADWRKRYGGTAFRPFKFVPIPVPE